MSSRGWWHGSSGLSVKPGDTLNLLGLLLLHLSGLGLLCLEDLDVVQSLIKLNLEGIKLLL